MHAEGQEMNRDACAHGWRAAVLLVLCGLPGLFSILLVMPDVPGAPRAALLIQPLILLVVLAFVGALAAPRVGLHSLLLEYAAGKVSHSGLLHWPSSALLGFMLGIALAIADAVTAPLWRPGPTTMHVVAGWQPLLLVTGILYGGIVEEIMMRFGVMSVLAWLFGCVAGDAKGGIARWMANIGAAILFGVLHLPAIAATGTEISAGVAIRTIGLNAIGGLTYGWLYMRRTLESAMIAHAATHFGFAVTALVWRVSVP